MKKIMLTALFGAMFVMGASAQKVNQVQYQETEANLLGVTANAAVRPLTVELKIKSQQRVREVVKIPRTIALFAMKGDPTNWRSYAVYEVSRRQNCDMLVAATFNIKYDEVAGDKEVEVEVVGYPADFVNWKTATDADLEWIRKGVYTTSDRTAISAAVRTEVEDNVKKR